MGADNTFGETNFNTKTMYKGQIADYPEWVVELMLQRQEEQGNKRDVSVFERNSEANKLAGGFFWDNTKEEHGIWKEAIENHNFQPLADFHKVDVKTGKPIHEFKFGDKVLCWWEDDNRKQKGIFIAKIEGKNPYLIGTKYDLQELEKNQCANFTSFTNISHVPKLTRKQIAEKFGIEDFELID